MNKLFYLSFLIIFFIAPKSYAVNICSSSSSSAASGTVYDSGGATGYYSNYENCGFLIQPSSSPSAVTLSFSQFSVEPASSGDIWDYLEVYDGTSVSGTLLGRFYGSSLPSNITASSGSMYLRFRSDWSWIYPGFTASWTTTTSNTSCETVKDNFSSLSYSNNDGTQNWTGAWQEVGESDGVSAGKARVRNDLCSSGYCLRLGTPSEVAPSSYTNSGAVRQADLSGSSSATLSFNYFTGVLNGSSTVVLSVSDDGGTSWTSLKTYTISSTNFSANPESFDITPYISANTQIRFLDSGSSSSVTGMYIDDIKIEYCQSTTPTTDPTAILEYKFDACSLASTVEDTQGTYDGIATGTDSTDSTSILGGRSLDLSATDTSDWVTVPTSAINGLNDFSFSVWIKTATSTEQQEIFQALGSSTDDDEFEIYLKNSDEINIKIKDVDKTLLTNKTLTDNVWHHLVLTRQSDTICLYVDGSQTDCDTGAETGSLSVTIANSVVIGQEQDSTRSSPSLNSGFISAQSFKGYIDELKIYDSTLSSTQIQTLYNDENSGDNTSTCSGGGGDTPAANFNCVENGANGITGNLYTKTTAQSFSFDIVALQDASTIETSFASGADHTVTVELVNAETAASCDSYPALTPSVSQSLNITASDTGIKASASMISSAAYSKVKCRVTDATDSPSIIGCSTDSFAIRPTSITISSNLTNTGSTGLPKTKAGDNFTLTATTTAGYNGTPSINNSNIQAHAGAIQTGSISGAFSAANSTTGIATGSTFNYSEVGLLRFSAQGVYDDSFTAVDQAGDCTDDYSNSVVSGKVGCKFGNTSSSDYFGRFTPDHFKITTSTNGVFADACIGFTYIGQTFSYQTAPTLTVTAYNGLSTPTVTANYTGSSYSKLVATDFNVTAPTTDSTQMGTDGSTLINIESWTPGTPTLADNGDGSLTFAFGADDYKYQHETNSKIASFIPTIDLSFSNITDSDSIQTQALPHTIQASGTSIRFGRLNIDNVHGSELMDLAVPVYTEYYNGTSFITNTADLCTTIAISELSFNGGTNPITVNAGTSTASIANSPLDQGEAGLSLSAPSVTGYIDIASDAFITSHPWLGYDWDGGGTYDDAPSSRATFGIYKGNSQQIYFREVY